MRKLWHASFLRSASSKAIPAILSSVVLGAGLPAWAAPAGELESCEFRIVDWNAAGSGDNLNNDAAVALAALHYVDLIDANVLTLQEVTSASLSLLAVALPGWTCESQMFGPDDIAICVDGTATNFNFKPLSDSGGNPTPGPPYPFWGYVQVEYEGVLITSVHIRNFWDVEQIAELHEDVTTGIVAGDFNHEEPGWHETDPNLIPTHDSEGKIDHILAVEEPQQFWGSVGDKHGSNHRVVMAGITFHEDPKVGAAITNAQQPIEVDGSCAGIVEFQLTLHDNCCLDPNDLALEVTAGNPTANATLGPVVIDSVVALGPRDVEVSGHVAVSALQSCPAQVIVEASAQDCFGNPGDTASQGTSASALVVDASPPVVEAGGTDLYSLWPPNHRYVCFDAGQFGPVIADNCTPNPTWEFAGCTSNQPDNGPGDGNTSNDCVLDSDLQGFCARAERAGRVAAGRRYGLDVEATDVCGNVSVATPIGNIHVPRNKKPALTPLAPAHP